ncbi:hypothetical protein FVE85_1139 [Porphyridium purpureum]|uniref:Uncharacterized protein n=1 Tax=Porphyridium purpureum TaxID=35688 RepID=A0A5J4Z295_PORPP|nr:hypothetical protein FVE85_1139 [Porphyridium purpureum]|eukprot:POR6499..scf208_2
MATAGVKKFVPKSALLAARAAGDDAAAQEQPREPSAAAGKQKKSPYPMGLSKLDVMVAVTFVALAVCTPLVFFAGNRVVALKTERSRVPQFVTSALKADWANTSSRDADLYMYEDVLGNHSLAASIFADTTLHDTTFVVHKYKAGRSLVETSVRNTSIVGMGLSSKLELARSSLDGVSIESISVLKGFRSTRSHLHNVVLKNPVVYDKPIVSQSLWRESVHQGAVTMKHLYVMTSLFYDLVFEESLDVQSAVMSDSVLRRLVVLGALKATKGHVSSCLISSAEFNDVHLTSTSIDATNLVNTSLSGLTALTDVSIRGSQLVGLELVSDFAVQGLTLKASTIDWLSLSGTSIIQGLHALKCKISNVLVEGNSLIRDASFSGLSVSAIRFDLPVSFAGVRAKKSTFTDILFASGASFVKLVVKGVSLSASEARGNVQLQGAQLVSLALDSMKAQGHVNLSYAHVDRATFTVLDLRGGVDMKATRWSKSELKDVVLAGDVNARDSVWKNVVLSNIRSVSRGSDTAEFSGALLRKSSFLNSSFAHEVNFARADLRAIVFESIHFLDDVDFEDAVLHNVVFRNVTFGSHAKFDSAKLKSCVFEGCVFKTKVKARHVDLSKDTKFIDCSFPGKSTFATYSY